MKNKILFTILAFTYCASSATAQHENCDHGDAPDAALHSGVSRFVQIDKMSLDAINLTTEKSAAKNIEKTVAAIGRIENIPSNIFAVSSRVAGRIVELYVSPDMKVKKGDPICKIESLLPGNPPPSILLRSPSDGIVESLNAVTGSPVEPSSEIARIVDTSKLYAVANVFERDICKLKAGTSARIKLEAFNDKIFFGRLAKFGSSISAGENVLPVYFELENPNGIIKGGMRGILYIPEASERVAVTVPRNAVIGDIGRKFVFVEICPEDKIYEKRQVVTGRSDDLRTEILHGLKAGETVASNGVYQLQFMPPADPQALEHAHLGETPDNHAKESNLKEPAIDSPSGSGRSIAEGSPHKIQVNAPENHPGEETPEEGKRAEDIWERLGSSGYFTYLPYALLAASILLNAVFAAAYARNTRNNKKG